MNWMGAAHGGNDYCIDIAIDSSNKIWIVVDNEQNDEIFLERYSRNGAFEKFFHWDYFDNAIPTCLTIDSSDHKFIGGYFYNGLSKNTDFLLIRTESSGVFEWHREWGGSEIDKAYDIIFDSNENIYIFGSTSSFGSGQEDLCLLKYSNNGFSTLNLTWGGYLSDSGQSLICDSSDNVFLTGITHSYGAGLSDSLLIKSSPIFEINVNDPIEHQAYGYDAPTFQIEAISQFNNSRWYTVNEGNPYYFSGNSGTINQTAWQLCNDGQVVIKFYANNSMGDIIIGEVSVIKSTDNDPPELTIISPRPYEQFNEIAPNFEINVTDSNLDLTWYSLNSGPDYFFTGNIGVINQTAWDSCNNGTISIKFYANDTNGNVAFSEITVLKGTMNLKTKNAYAIIIGIENYPGTLNDLYYCVDDANSIYNYLRIECNVKEENMIRLLNSQATYQNIGSAFQEIRSKIRARDLFFLYYAGHGGTDGGTDHFICPYDSIPSSPIYYYYDWMIDMELDFINCDEKYVIIDACNSGGMIPEAQAPKRYFMTGCQEHELSWETSELRHGVFTNFFLDSSQYASDSNGDGVLSLEEQFSYTYPLVVSYTAGLGGSAHPQQYDGITGPTVVYPSIADLSFIPFLNQLDFSFFLYGHGALKTLSLTIYSVSPNFQFETTDIKYLAPSDSGFGSYSGQVQLDEGYNLTGYELLVQIEGYRLKTYRFTFDEDTDGDGLFDILEINEGMNPLINDTDGDQLSDYDEFYGITNPLLNDTDSDGMPDGFEVINGLNPILNDSLNDLDNDNLTNIAEFYLGTLVNDEDTDNDGIYDGYEYYNGLDVFTDDANLDYDDDTLTNLLEFQLGSLANNSDTDGDTMPDGWEYNNNLNLLVNDTHLDYDNDGLINLFEYQYGSFANNNDTDEDGMPDGWEYENGLDLFIDDANLDPDGDELINVLEYQSGSDINNSDTDGDTMPDGWEYYNNLNLLVNDTHLDYDNDGLSNLLEYQLGSSANNIDTDGDGMPDGWEHNNELNLLVNDADLDPDSDGLKNIGEFQNDTNPHVQDTDGDTWNDGDEVERGTDPLDPDDYPKTQSQAILGYQLIPILSFIFVAAVVYFKKSEIIK